MYGLDITLKEFVNQIPSCLQGDSLEQILEVALSGKSEAIAVLNSQHYPVGTIDCHSLLSLLTKHCVDLSTVAIGCDALANHIDKNIVGGEILAPSTTKFNHLTTALNTGKSVTLLNTLIKPAITFSGRISIAELLSQLPNSTHSLEENPTYLITNSQGQLLGKLNITKVLQHLWLNAQKNRQKPLMPGLDNHLVSFLEAIDLPLKIQTATGRVLYQNSCWLKLFRDASSASQPIAQWWLEQQSHIDGFKATSMPPSESSCLKSNINFNPRATLSASLPVNREYQLGKIELSDRHEANINLIQTDLKSQRDDDYIQITLNLNNKSSISTQSSDLKLILAVPAPNSPSDSHSSQDAELIELNRLKDELLASISHELKSPLTGIVGLSSLLKEEKLGKLNQRQRHYTELIYRGGRKLIAIVSDLLDLTSLATGKLQLNLESINLEPFCREVYQQVLSRLKATATDNDDLLVKEANLHLSIESKVQKAIADRLRLRQILSHLLTNSLKLHQPHNKVGIKINSWDNWIAITVWDDGGEISEAKQRSLLQPTIDSKNACLVPEVGLGIVIAQQLAKIHGGELSFVSQVDRGNEFTVLLPSQPSGRDRLDREVRVANSLVLVVETISSKIATITSRIRELGYCPIVARSGTEVLDKARQLKPGCILLNPNLPLLSAKDVLTLLKSDPRTNSSSVVIMTTPENLASERSLYPQADEFISQPLKATDLTKILPSIERTFFSSPHNSTISDTSSQVLRPKALTILCLYPEPELILEPTTNNINNSSFNLKYWAEQDWANYDAGVDGNNYHCRIIEADGLEQADMLARIWHLDTIVLDGSSLKEPLAYLRSLQASEDLATLPLVTLDAITTAAANQVEGLKVYPCLLPAASRNNHDLMQVIQIAAANNQ